MSELTTLAQVAHDLRADARLTRASMTPLPGWWRCKRHEAMYPVGRACVLCIEEADQSTKQGKAVTLAPLRGERFEDAAGRVIEVERT